MVKKELIIVGDKVLVEPDEGPNQTEHGLYLPQGVKEREKVQSGTIIKVGPGYPIPDASILDSEPWVTTKKKDRYFPLQAKEGDYCIFLRDSGIEIEFEGEKYVVVPYSAILVLMRKSEETLENL